MPQKPGPDPSQQLQPPASTRPGDDGPIADAILALPALPTTPEPAAPSREPGVLMPADLSDEELLARPWRAEAGHVGNWQKGKVIPPGNFADAAWVKKSLTRGAISPVEDEGE